MAQQERETKTLSDVPFCEAKHRLMGCFTAANHELMELHIQQTQAVIDGDPDFSRFDDLIHMAREKRDDAKYALITHLEGHQC
jgi:hypothetical protein